MGCSSVSELVEQVGRGQLYVRRKSENGQNSKESELSTQITCLEHELKDFLEAKCDALVKEVMASLPRNSEDL